VLVLPSHSASRWLLRALLAGATATTALLSLEGASADEASSTSEAATLTAEVAALTARLADLEQRALADGGSELARLVHEFQRERVQAHAEFERALAAVRAGQSAELAQATSAHNEELHAAEQHLRVEYEAATARLAAELAESYAAQLKHLVAERDADVAREFAELSERLQHTLNEAAAVEHELAQRSDAVVSSSQLVGSAYGASHDALRLALAVHALLAAMHAGSAPALHAALDHARTVAQPFPAVAAALAAVPSGDEGVATMSALAADLNALEPQARRAASEASGDKTQLLKDWLVQPPSGLVLGDDVASKLARARFHAERGNLESAVAETSSLPLASLQVLSEWTRRAERRLMVLDAIDLAQATAQARAKQEPL